MELCRKISLKSKKNVAKSLEKLKNNVTIMLSEKISVSGEDSLQSPLLQILLHI